jgi:tight adherence protein B
MRSALYDTTWGPLVLGLAVGCLVLVAAVAATATPRKVWIRNRLGLPPEEAPAKEERPRGLRARFAFLLGATERALGGVKLFAGLERKLEQANLRLRAVELVYLSIGSGLVVALVVAFLGRSGFATVLGFAAGVLAPHAVVNYKASRRTRAFEDQLPDVLMTMSASLQVGHSFSHGMRTVVDKGQAPASEEFERVLGETRLGRPLEDALDEMGLRVGSENLRFVLMSVAIQRQIGGSLAGLFDTISETIRDRQQFQRKVRALTAMGKMSAYLLMALPLITALLIAVINPEYISPLFDTSTGQILVVVALAMMGVGALFLRKIANFKG